MPTTVTTIDKGDLICWATQEDSENYIVWDVGVAQLGCHSRTEWVQIKFKKLGLTDYPIKSIVMVPISQLHFGGEPDLIKKIKKQQGDKCWCIRFKDMD